MLDNVSPFWYIKCDLIIAIIIYGVYKFFNESTPVSDGNEKIFYKATENQKAYIQAVLKLSNEQFMLLIAGVHVLLSITEEDLKKILAIEFPGMTQEKKEDVIKKFNEEKKQC